MLSQEDYNDIGQLQAKHLHSTNGGGSFLQDINYAYNERGWLQGSSAGLFQEQLEYNSNPLSAPNFAAQYNGNIGAQGWGTAASPNGKNYVYTYDKLNRLTAGTGSDNNTESGISYDEMGNIQALTRSGQTIKS